MLTLRLLPPRSYRERHRLPEWEILDADGVVVGWIDERSIANAGSHFFALIALHPTTGERIPLELSTDIDERLAKLALFLENPDRFSMHYPSGSRARRELEARLGGPEWLLRQRAADEGQ